MSRVGVNRQFTLLFHFLVSGPTLRRVITGKYIVKRSNFDVTHAHTSLHERSIFRHLPIFKVWTISRVLQTCRMSQTDSPQGQTLYLQFDFKKRCLKASNLSKIYLKCLAQCCFNFSTTDTTTDGAECLVFFVCWFLKPALKQELCVAFC